MAGIDDPKLLAADPINPMGTDGLSCHVLSLV